MTKANIKNHTEISERFLQIESDLSVFDLHIEGIPIWERIRHHVHRNILKQTGAISRPHSKVSLNYLSYFKSLNLMSRNMFVNNPLLSKSVSRLYVGTGRRKQLSDGFWWDIFCDPIHEHEDSDYLQIDFPHENSHKEPSKTENLRYMELISYTGKAAQKAPRIGYSISSASEKKLSKVEEEIKNVFSVSIDIVSTVEDVLTYRHYVLQLYYKLLERINPDVVIVVVSYGKETLIEACKKHEIPVIELQHGVVYNHHMGYSYPSDRVKEMFPDYILTFGDFWTEEVEFPVANDRVISVGYPFLEQSAKRYKNITSKKQLLFISQGTIGEELSKFAIAVDKDPTISHDVIYKLHPGEYNRWQDDYPWLQDASFEIVDGTDQSRHLYKLFAESDAQVGVGSTAVYEGLMFELETYIYDAFGSEVLMPLVEAESATLISSVDELASSLGTESVAFDSEYYFSTNSVERACNTIRRITKEESSNRS